MANLPIDSVASSLKGGSFNELMGNTSINAPAAPEAPALRAMAQEGMQVPVESSGDAAKGFGQMLTDSITKVNEYQQQADTSMKELTAGRTKNIHETMLSIEKADPGLKLIMQVRKNVLDAYKEIMRMQV